MNRLDEVRKRDQLLDWVEQGLLTTDQLEQALAPEAPWPANRHWRWALDRLLAYFGSLLLALGVIFFFAFNWDELHRLHKLLLALTALTGFAGAALCLPPAGMLYRACLFGAALTTGGVLALVGQTYQTGADVWQLFASWALLILPWALLSRSAACWALFWLVLNLALLRYFAAHQGWLNMGRGSVQGLWAVTIGNAFMLLVFEVAGSRLLLHAGRSLPRLAGFVLLSALTLGAGASWWQAEYRQLLVGLGLVYLVGIPLYRQWRPDLLLLALLLYSLVGVTSMGVARWLGNTLNDFMLFNVLGLFVLLTSGLASLWLLRLHKEQSQ